jgi:glycosyltransferase involved in cell wall biosynthesis
VRIAIVTETFLPKIDGIVTMVVQTAACLRSRGDDVVVFAPEGGPAEIEGAQVIGLPAVRFPLYPELRVAAPRASMRGQLQAFGPDVLHLFEPSLLGIGGIYYGRALNVPLVISYHTNLPAYLDYYGLGFLEDATWKLMRLRHRQADINLCTSTAMVDELRTHGVERLTLWERAVDAQRFHPAKRSEAMRSTLSRGESHKPLLLYVGRLSAEKEVASLRSAIDALPEARLAIVGDGPMRDKLERQFRGTATHFAGYLRGEELAAAYASADVFVMPSRTETLGLVLLEAMASGCPVVACRAGGIPDAVEDGVTGYLFEPTDADGLVQAIRRVLACPVQRAAIQRQARADVERRSWQSATDRLRVHYQEAIEERRPMPVREPPRRAERLARRSTLALLRRLLP